MPKLKQPVSKPNSKTLRDFLASYPATALHGALQTFDGSLGWELMKAYVSFTQRSYEVSALDLMAKDGQEKVASYAAGYAKACEDLPGFIEGLRSTILGGSQVIEAPMPEE